MVGIGTITYCYCNGVAVVSVASGLVLLAVIGVEFWSLKQ